MTNRETDARGLSARCGTLWTDLTVAATFLTRVPLGASGTEEGQRLGDAAWAFPLVGAAVGGVGALAFAGGWALGLSPWLAAMLAVAVQLIATGALHEDGLADVADGFGGGATPERKLAIMRDSRIGSYGVCAIALALMARVGVLTALPDLAAVASALVAAGALSRGALVALLYWMPPARPDGLGAAAGRPSPGTALATVGLSIICAAILAVQDPWLAALAVICAGAAALALARLAWRQIRGYTGDVLGASQQAAEIGVLLAAAIVFA